MNRDRNLGGEVCFGRDVTGLIANRPTGAMYLWLEPVSQVFKFGGSLMDEGHIWRLDVAENDLIVDFVPDLPRQVKETERHLWSWSVSQRKDIEVVMMGWWRGWCVVSREREEREDQGGGDVKWVALSCDLALGLAVRLSRGSWTRIQTAVLIIFPIFKAL
jgi:hypothetical protein